MMKEGDELPLSEISEETKALAEILWHEAKVHRIYSIIELALRDARQHGYFCGLFEVGEKDEAPNAAGEGDSNPQV